jgi:hypothetical protein
MQQARLSVPKGAPVGETTAGMTAVSPRRYLMMTGCLRVKHGTGNLMIAAKRPKN